MPLKIRQKKKQPEKRHLSYQPNVGTHWSKEYRERNKGDMRKSFIAIMVVVVIVLILLIATIVRAAIPDSATDNTINAADTFAISKMEQQDMIDKAENFAQGVLVYAYCSDSAVANQGKTAALMNMAQNTAAYREVENLSKVSPIVAPANFVPIITEPTLIDPTQSYADTFTYEFDGVVVDSSVTSESNPNGTFVDRGYHFVVTFSYVTNEDTDSKTWVISDVQMNPNYTYGIYAQSNDDDMESAAKENASTQNPSTNTNAAIPSDSNAMQNAGTQPDVNGTTNGATATTPTQDAVPNVTPTPDQGVTSIPPATTQTTPQQPVTPTP